MRRCRKDCNSGCGAVQNSACATMPDAYCGRETEGEEEELAENALTCYLQVDQDYYARELRLAVTVVPGGVTTAAMNGCKNLCVDTPRQEARGGDNSC